MKTELIKRIYMKILWSVFPKSKKILFMSFNGLQYSDNPRAISEKMHELYPEYKLVWAIKDKTKSKIVPGYVKVVNSIGVEFYYTLATSFCFVTNTNNRNNIYKDFRKQFFIQTWHGDLGFKKALYDCWKEGSPEPEIRDRILTDLCVAASNYGEQQFRTAFRYRGEILKVGMPKNDILVNQDKNVIHEIKIKLGIDFDKKILVYAPTYRDSKRERQVVDVDLRRVISILETRGENWVCLIRAHSNTKILDFQYDEKQFIDVTMYPDMADLLAVCDLLITDYSSCAGDVIRAGKGAILAIFDMDDYVTNDRELHFDPRDKGFIVANSQTELERIVSTFDEPDYIRNARQLCETFEVVETGMSSRIICERIDNFYKKLNAAD